MSAEITWQTSRNGLRVPLINGRACHSLVDPLREAQRWATHIGQELQAPIRRVFILGGGAGYHVEALLQSCQPFQFEFCLIEKESVLADALRTRFSAYLSSAQLKIEDQRTVEAGGLQLFGKKAASTVAFMFAGAVQENSTFYFECRKQILAQTPESWGMHVNSRVLNGNGQNIFDLSQERGRHPVHMLIQEQREQDAISAALVELFT